MRGGLGLGKGELRGERNENGVEWNWEGGIMWTILVRIKQKR